MLFESLTSFLLLHPLVFLGTAATSWLDSKHVVFGRVISGQDVVSAIEQVGSESGRTRVQGTYDVVIQEALLLDQLIWPDSHHGNQLDCVVYKDTSIICVTQPHLFNSTVGFSTVKFHVSTLTGCLLFCYFSDDCRFWSIEMNESPSHSGLTYMLVLRCPFSRANIDR